MPLNCKIAFILLFLALAAYGQQTSVAVLPSDGSAGNDELDSRDYRASNESTVQKKIFTDSRDGQKYEIVKIGKQTWMAENLNYNASGSECYDNDPDNCQECGKLYSWAKAKEICPKFY